MITEWWTAECTKQAHLNDFDIFESLFILQFS